MPVADIPALRDLLAAVSEPTAVIVLDYGNVIARCDAPQVCRQLVRHTECGIDRIIHILHGSELHQEFNAGQIAPDAFWKRVRDELALTCTEKTFWSIYVDTWSAPDQSIIALVREVSRRGHRVVIFSNMDSVTLSRLRRRHARAIAAFDRAVFSCEVGMRKPEQAAYEHLAKLEGADRPFVFVDNDWKNLLPAERLGWQTIQFALSPR